MSQENHELQAQRGVLYRVLFHSIFKRLENIHNHEYKSSWDHMQINVILIWVRNIQILYKIFITQIVEIFVF